MKKTIAWVVIIMGIVGLFFVLPVCALGWSRLLEFYGFLFLVFGSVAAMVWASIAILE